MEMFWEWIDRANVLEILAVLGALGAAIGKGYRNQPFAGFVLGVLLGPFGWAMVLGLPDKRALCPECRESIAIGATRCKHCGSSFGLNQAKGVK